MSEDPILAHYRSLTDAQLREELAKPAITQRDDYRSALLRVVGEREAAKDQERSAMERRMVSASERSAAAAERAADSARDAKTIAIIAVIIATMLSAPMIAVAQSLIRFLR